MSFSLAQILLFIVAYLTGLFTVAYLADRGIIPERITNHPATYVLSLGVFAGATMEFHGAWTVHPKFGRQFKAAKAVERKPATAAALEKYLGSGLIKGVGPKTAKKIVKHFGADTLDVFENEIDRLFTD